PTAIRLAVLAKLPRLTAAVHAMAAEFSRLAEREKDTVKSGRTHLQDAVPTTLGHEFAGYAWTLTRCAASLDAVRPALCEIGLGGSAAGTGLNTSPDYPARAAAELATLTGEPIRVGQLVAQMQSMNDLARLSGEIRNLALELTRISNDLRLLAFVDGGNVYIQQPLPSQKANFTLAGTGIGLRFNGWDGVSGTLDWAVALRNLGDTEKGDSQAYFRLGYAW
ncbi:MAG: lyase family protein, partial [bacterium]|nr:lyase family protein [bacterium]